MKQNVIFNSNFNTHFISNFEEVERVGCNECTFCTFGSFEAYVNQGKIRVG